MSIRILIDAGNYFSNNDNYGDRAIYQSIVLRLHNIWPECEIRWITRNAKRLRATHPDVLPLELTEDRQPLGHVPSKMLWQRLSRALGLVDHGRDTRIRQAADT